jgi:hypothetical protein
MKKFRPDTKQKTTAYSLIMKRYKSFRFFYLLIPENIVPLHCFSMKDFQEAI